MSESLDKALTVARDRVVRFHYVIRDEAGSELESTREGEPLAVLQGRGSVLRGVEEALEGRNAGERLEVTLPPEQAFGARREDWTQRVPKKYLPDAKRLKPGDAAVLRTREGPRPVTVVKVGSKVVDVDLNHPRAGMTLTFDLEIVEVREATPEEIAHRHVHGPGGHRH
ncbi:MAG TPA: peptidylprolyl isomerase [Pseudomonadales bacterium]|jgi:FKBP-type peptidyl-prolyl cis-trans isomerase SlyD